MVSLGYGLGCLVYDDYREQGSFADDAFGDGLQPPPPSPPSSGSSVTASVSYDYGVGGPLRVVTISLTLSSDTVPSLRRKASAALGLLFRTLVIAEYPTASLNDPITSLSGYSVDPTAGLTAQMSDLGLYQDPTAVTSSVDGTFTASYNQSILATAAGVTGSLRVLPPASSCSTGAPTVPGYSSSSTMCLDSLSGYVLPAAMSAPAYYTVISPISTLIDAASYSLTSPYTTVAGAEVQIGTALGIPSGVTIASLDPLQALLFNYRCLNAAVFKEGLVRFSSETLSRLCKTRDMDCVVWPGPLFTGLGPCRFSFPVHSPFSSWAPKAVTTSLSNTKKLWSHVSVKAPG